MPNPIFNGLSNRANQPVQNQQPNNLFDLFQSIKNSSNPNAAMQNMLATNPNFQNVVNYINQNGGDAKTAFYNMAAQKGVDPNSILNPLKDRSLSWPTV